MTAGGGVERGGNGETLLCIGNPLRVLRPLREIRSKIHRKVNVYFVLAKTFTTAYMNIYAEIKVNNKIDTEKSGMHKTRI